MLIHKLSTVLVVDDELELLEVCRDFGMLTAPDAAAAIDLLAGVTAVYCDLEGIESKGLSAVDVLVRARSVGIPVFCTSGNPVKADEFSRLFDVPTVPKCEIYRHAKGGAS